MTYSRPWMYGGLALMALGAALLWRQDRQRIAMADAPPTGVAGASPEWQSLFDGKTLDGWTTPQFGGEGNVKVEDGAIIMELGAMMTGVTWAGDVVRDNYEIELEGKRIDGNDFFCTTTFPVGDDYCSLVVGGWGGSLVGLSSIDYADASENMTSQAMSFKDGKWYPIRIRVSSAAVQVWIDGKRIINQPRQDHHFSIRIEVSDCRPLGISTWCTSGAVRNIRIRSLKPDEIAAVDEAEE